MALIRKLQAQGIHVAAMGLQGHDKMDWPTVGAAGLDDHRVRRARHEGQHHRVGCRRVAARRRAVRPRTSALRAGFDASANPFAAGLPDSVQQALAKRYADLFAVFLKHRDVIDRVTFWGVADGGFVAEQLARSRTDELSVVVRSPASAEAGVRCRDRRRTTRRRRAQSLSHTFIE